MNKDILKDIFRVKMELLEDITEHLPPAAKEKLGSIQRSLMAALSEATCEYLQKRKPDTGSKGITAVKIE